MSAEQLTCISLNIHTTSVCTLKCEKCGWSFPRFNPHVVADLEKTIAGLDKVFQIYDVINEVRFGGAEAFLYPDIEKLMTALIPYQDRFEYGIVITNGTYIPKQSILDTMRQLPYPFMVRVDNYGQFSTKYDEVVAVLKQNQIKEDERTYTGVEQAFGGGVIYGEYTGMQY